MKNLSRSFRISVVIPLTAFLIITFSSCSNYMNLEKRHYRNGFYVSIKKEKSKSDVYNKIIGETAIVPKISKEIKPIESSVLENKNVDSIILKKENKLIPTEIHSGKKIFIKNKIQNQVKVATKLISKHSIINKTSSKLGTRENVGPGLFTISILGIIVGLALVLAMPSVGAAILLGGILALILCIVANRQGNKHSENSQNERAEYLRRKHSGETFEKGGNNGNGNGIGIGFFLPFLFLLLLAGLGILLLMAVLVAI